MLEDLIGRALNSADVSAMFCVSASAFRTILRSDIINSMFVYAGVVVRIAERIYVQSAQAFMMSVQRHFAKILNGIGKQYLNE